MFSELVEQKAAKALLSADLSHDRLAPFYLFAGPQGVGKALAARLFARSILCGKGGGDGCRCKSCALYRSGNHPDFLRAADDAETEIKVETVAEVRKFLSAKPMLSSRRVVLIEDAERLNQHAQNGLLKSLEEPPHGTVLMLTVNRAEALLPTIPSRARIVRFGHLSRSGMTEVLKRHQVADADMDILIDVGGGSPGKALGLSSFSAAVSKTALGFREAIEKGVSPVKAEALVAEALANLPDNAAKRAFLAELIAVLSVRYRKDLARLGSEPLGTVLSVLVEAYRAVRQNVAPELVVLSLASRIPRALAGETLPNRGVFI
jgi:DNA polymerase-3 subunit delta'